MVDVQDVRGQEPAASSAPVLADPSGRRWRVLRLLSWLIAVVFVLWFMGLALAGLGLIPGPTGLLGGSLLGHGAPALHRSSGSTHHLRA